MPKLAISERNCQPLRGGLEHILWLKYRKLSLAIMKNGESCTAYK